MTISEIIKFIFLVPTVLLFAFIILMLPLLAIKLALYLKFADEEPTKPEEKGEK